MTETRPIKTLRLTYRSDFGPYLWLAGNPSEVRIGSNPKTFISVRDEGITLSPGIGQNVNIQGMSQNLKFGGMVTNLDFPLSIIPITAFNPMPVQRFSPPMAGIMSILSLVSTLSTGLAGGVA
jgi:hypothetical protein